MYSYTTLCNIDVKKLVKLISLVQFSVVNCASVVYLLG